MSNVCAAFHCLPDEAKRQDRRLVNRILYLREAQQAVAIQQAGRLAEVPAASHVLLELSLAQRESIAEWAIRRLPAEMGGRHE